MSEPIQKLPDALERCFDEEECKGVYKHGTEYFLSNSTETYAPKQKKRASFVVMKCTTNCTPGNILFY